MKKKILFFINTLCAGGAERVLVDMVNNMDKEKYSITIQTFFDGGEFSDNLRPHIEHKSIIRVKNSFLRKAIVYALSFIIPPRIVHRLFIGNKYDYECAYLEGVPTKLIAASGNKNARKYAWVHTDICNNLKVDKVFGSINKQIKCYRKYDKIVCVSQGVKESLMELCGNFENAEVVYNVINDKKIKALAQEQNCNGSFKIVTVGRLEEPKGYDRLLRVHKRLMDEGFKYKLKFVGDGSKREELQAYVEDNALAESTEFVGYCDNPYKYIITADLLVSPSRVEGFSTVVCESLILGKPIVATDCCGTKEILGNSEFGLVTENNEEAIYEGIKKMLLDKNLRLQYSDKALCRAKDFSLENGIRELEKLFE